MQPANFSVRRPLIAVVLSLFCTGLGHIYCGRFVKGMLLFSVSLIYAPITFLAAWASSADIVMLGVGAAYAIVTIVYFYAIVDSFRLARRVGADYQPADYNHVVVYGLFILMATVYPLGIASRIRANVYEAFYCPAASMTPTVLKGDRFLVNKMVYDSQSPERGDVIVFRAPDRPEMQYVKRVIGLPGDRVSVRNYEVILNGRRLERDEVLSASTEETDTDARTVLEKIGDRSYSILVNREDPRLADFNEVEVPPRHCFVLGDNREKSLDSRSFGFVPLGDIAGRAQYIYLPAGSWARFGLLR